MVQIEDCGTSPCSFRFELLSQVPTVGRTPHRSDFLGSFGKPHESVPSSGAFQESFMFPKQSVNNTITLAQWVWSVSSLIWAPCSACDLRGRSVPGLMFTNHQYQFPCAASGLVILPQASAMLLRPNLAQMYFGKGSRFPNPQQTLPLARTLHAAQGFEHLLPGSKRGPCAINLSAGA